MAPYLAPGVYLRPRRTEQPVVGLVRTDVAAFVGFTERGPLALPSLAAALRREPRPEDLAIRLNSWDEFRANFGGLIQFGLLPYAVRGFFQNGGRTCRVARVAAVSHSNPARRPRVARWLFRGAAVRRAPLQRAAAAGDYLLATPLAALLASNEIPLRTTGLIEIAPPDGSQSEFHVRVPPPPDVETAATTANGPMLEIAGGLGRSYPAGATIVLHEAALEIEATSAGNWGNRIRLRLTPLTLAPGDDSSGATDFSLRVTLDPGPDSSHPREEEFYRRLSVDQRDDSRRPSSGAVGGERGRRSNPEFAPDVVNARSRVVRVVFPPQSDDLSVPRPIPSPIILDDAVRFGPPLRLEGGRDGVSGMSRAPRATIGQDWLASLRQLEAIDEVSILCAPDVVLEPSSLWTAPQRPLSPPCSPSRPEAPPDVIADDPTARPEGLVEPEIFSMYTAMVEQCERHRDRVALLDPPQSANNVKALLSWRKVIAELPGPARRFAACYAPWMAVTDPVRGGARRLVPPSGHVAGVYAQVDNAFGVHRPPANVAVVGVDDVAEALSAREQEELNPRGINLLRPFPGRGIRVWGARSLSDDPEWRFIHVRRVMSMIEESVDDSTQWAVFEPNDDTLRRTLTHSLSVFLRGIWESGGLQGTVPEEAFFVKCDDTNNPPAIVASGQVICQVGIAVAAPMEFLVFEVRQQAAGANIVEG